MPSGISGAALSIAVPPCARPGARATLSATALPCHASSPKAHAEKNHYLGMNPIPKASKRLQSPFAGLGKPRRIWEGPTKALRVCGERRAFFARPVAHGDNE